MPWTYIQKTGAFIDPSGKTVHRGYSGKGSGRNNPAMEAVKGTGPIPCGTYIISGHYDSQKVGPFALVLEPAPGTNTLGRGDFRIHGDNKAGDASEGCPIAHRSIRKMIWDSGDRTFVVESGA
jgi:hypothetical protein